MPIANVPPRALQTLRILWFALTASTVALFVVLGKVERPKTQPEPTIAMAMAVAALVVSVVSVVLPLKQMRIAAGFRERSPLPVIHTAFVLGMALTESVALFGFVLGFQNFAAILRRRVARLPLALSAPDAPARRARPCVRARRRLIRSVDLPRCVSAARDRAR